MRTLDVGWTCCAATPECHGSVWWPYQRCLAHLDDGELAVATRDLAPGSPVDLRGTAIGRDLLTRILTATSGVLGRARFERAAFAGDARFGGVTFRGDASFDHAGFGALASFIGARFAGNASFRGVRFAKEVTLHGAAVAGHLAFDHATVGRDALFGDARFARTACFEGAEFRGFATFDAAAFGGDATFRGARFARAVSFRNAGFGGPARLEAARFSSGLYLTGVTVGRRLSLAGSTVGGRLALVTGSCEIDLRGLRVRGPMAAQLHDADADLEHATLHGPSTLTGGGTSRVRSLRGLDAEELELARVDLSTCRFAGVRRPDRLRLISCAFAVTPRGVRFELSWPPLRWWARRRAIADEHAWRGWSPPGAEPPPAQHAPQLLAVLYSHLGSGVDDRATAADFRFAAMEMRRLTSVAGRRWLLSAYWIISGYGQRTGRMLGWALLLAAVAGGGIALSATSHAARRPPGIQVAP